MGCPKGPTWDEYCGKDRADDLRRDRREGVRRYDTKLQQWRAAVRGRDGDFCTECGAPSVLVHHIIPVRDRPEERFDVNNGTIVCYRCHRLLHAMIEAQFDTGVNRTPSQETREKIRRGNLGKSRSPESIEKGRQSHLGLKRPSGFVENLRAAWQRKMDSGEYVHPKSGKTHEEYFGEDRAKEVKAKIGKALLGKPKSPESIARQKETLRRKREERNRNESPGTVNGDIEWIRML